MLDRQIAELQIVDDARARWLAHTALTRVNADRSADALAARHAAREAPEPDVTGDEWLAAHDDATRAEDQHREITDETDLDPIELDDRGVAADAGIETMVEHVREIAADEPPAVDEDAVRVRSTEETAGSVRQAQRSLAEIEARTIADAAREAEESRSVELARWHEDDQVTAEQEMTDGEAFAYDDAR